MASPRKPCKKCKKQIPAIALDCVFCGAKQEAPPLEELLPAALTRAKEVAAKAEQHEAAGGSAEDFADAFSTEPTLVGLKVQDLAALGIGAPQPSQGGAESFAAQSAQPAATPVKSVYGDPVEPAPAKPAAKEAAKPTEPKSTKSESKPESKSAPPSTKSTQITSTIAPPPDAAPARPAAEPRAPEAALRLAQTIGIGAGIVLVVLFFLPWGGATSWQLLENLGFRGFMRQFWYLVGGVTLVATAALPLPVKFRTLALVAVTAPILAIGPVAGGLASVLALVAFGGLAAATVLELSSTARRSVGIAFGVIVAAMCFLARGTEFLHIFGWVAAAAGAYAGQLISPWPSARRSTAG